MTQNSEPIQPSFAPLQTHHLSHDLRGPLNSMLGFTELLLDGIEGPLNDIQTEDITAIRQSAVNLLRLINTVVDLGKIEAGQLKLTTQPATLDDALSNAIKKLPPAKAAQIRPNISLNLPPVLANPQRIEESIFSILTYLLAKNEVSQVAVNTSTAAGIAAVTFAADDLWLAAEQTAHLFELTVKVDPTGHAKLTEGGVFLPLAQRLVQLQHGDLAATSSAENGTVFQLTLPLATT